MRYNFFLHYGWFFQNLGKEAVRTFMHTTVILYKKNEKITYLHCVQKDCQSYHWNTSRLRNVDIYIYHYLMYESLFESIFCLSVFWSRFYKSWTGFLVPMQGHTKGPSLYYVSIFLDFFWPTHYVSINTVLNVIKTGHFLDLPIHSFCWRNIYMELCKL